MRPAFRFPKPAGLFMTLTLALVLLAIEKGNEISVSMSAANSSTRAIRWMRFALLPGTLETFFVACVVGAAIWCGLFAARRSGLQRLSELDPSVSEKQHGSL